MKLHGPPFDQVIEEMIFNIMMGGEALAYETITVDDTAIKTLVLPTSTTWVGKFKYAQIIVEADTTTTAKSKAIRFLECDKTPANLTISLTELKAKGMPLGDMGVYEVKGLENLAHFKFVGLEAGKVHSLRIQYYG